MLAVADDADECTNVIAVSKTTNTVISDQREVESQAANFCSEYQKHSGSSEDLSASGSFKFLSASLGLSQGSVEDIASKYCSASNNYAARSDSYHQYLEGIAPQAFDAYKSCIEYSHAQLKFKVREAAVKPKELEMYAQYASSYRGVTNALLQVNPSAGVSCTWDSTSSNTEKVATGSTAGLHCTRDFQDRSSYVTIANKNDAATSPFVLPWAAYAADGTPIDTLRAVQGALADLQSQLTRVSAEAKESAEELTRLRNSDGATSDGKQFDRGTEETKSCPAGQYVSGIHPYWNAPGHQDAEVGNLRFECRKVIPDAK
jgi:hypothetical protein